MRPLDDREMPPPPPILLSTQHHWRHVDRDIFGYRRGVGRKQIAEYRRALLDEYVCNCPGPPPPCGGVFMSTLRIRPETTREDVLAALERGLEIIKSPSGDTLNWDYCCRCGVWLGDVDDAEIAHVSISLDEPCVPDEIDDEFDAEDYGVYVKYMEDGEEPPVIVY